MKKALALSGGVLLALTSLVTTAGVASAQGNDHGRNRVTECSVELDQHRRTLEIDIESDSRGGNAFVEIDFDGSRRDDVRRWVDLNRRGNADLDVSIPRRTDSVEVTVEIGRGRNQVTCNATLDLDRRGGNNRI